MAKKTEESKLAYGAALLLARLVTQTFFREIRPRGAFHVPKEGPVILVAAPHHNQFVDPAILAMQVYLETRRFVRFLIAAASLDRAFVGFLARCMASIPVSRAADNAKKGKGSIYLDDDDPCLVKGVGTEFTQLKPRTQIMLSKALNSATAEVTEVLSDTEVRVKKEFGGEKGTSRFRQKVAELKSEGGNGLDEWKSLPYVDQGVMFRHVYQSLKEGGIIGIFPEGGSHDRTDLLPLKAGVSMMALGAMANDPNCKVKVVPVGLSYFHAHRFRSRAVVEFGQALDVPAEYVEMFKQGGTQKREAVQKFLDLIYDGLKTVTVRAPDYDTLMLVQATRRLYRTPGQHLSLSQVVELNRRFLEGYEHFKDDPRVQKLRADVQKYNRLVRDLGLRDHQVPRAEKATWKIASLMTYRIGLLLVWTVFALPGTILNAPLFIVASIISRKKAKEALAASTVKIQAKDVLATWKVLVSVGLVPVMYSFYAVVATMIAIKANASRRWRIFTPIFVTVALPFTSFAALRFGEAGMDVLKSLRPLVVSLAPGQSKQLTKLRAMRAALANEVAEVINEFGPKLYEDFDEHRIMVPSASAPPSIGQEGIRRRKQTSAEDLLVHPMTWIDERLFGWSKSASRGRSAWGGATPNLPTSGSATPELSDDEDHGDYDHVINFLNADHDIPGSPRHSRSRNSSFADLQRLRMSAEKSKNTTTSPSLPTAVPNIVSPAPDANGEGNGTRTSPRNRRHSLTDIVQVERIASEDSAKSFEEMTKELNDELHPEDLSAKQG